MTKLSLFLGLLMLSASLVVTGCKKDENPASGGTGGGGNQTPTGAGTLSAKIDGQNWSATQISPILPAAIASYQNNTLLVNGTRVDGATTSALGFTITGVTGTGTFRLGVSPGTGGAQGTAQYVVTTAGQGQTWATLSQTGNSGTITITTFDRQNRIAAGTFSFTLERESPAPTRREVTEGRFDVRWNQ
ncbi:MAG: hypothetical protein NZM06_10560 [Chloroherpetonaceae bacterium]|nr:hypothetical protein [Chloroherpetonaceae bacterium]MDW8437086.1 hypothetical protein [Chloroherpetonaceae bacterium]